MPAVDEMKKKILLVDDEPDIALVFKTILENEGYQVVVAIDGIDGLNKAVSERPDLIILDMKMPYKDGPETLRELKMSELTKMIPVVMLSASIVAPPIPGCLELGAADYLYKTCDTKMFLECVKRNIL